MKDYKEIRKEVEEEFISKLKSYGPSWKVFRKESIRDQVLIKVNRNRTLEEIKDNKVNESIEDNLRAIVNYSIIALILRNGGSNFDIDYIENFYKSLFNVAEDLYIDKTHDYGDAWKFMSVKSFTDISLTKLMRIENQFDSDYETSSIVLDAYFDIINYSMFYLMRRS